MKLGAIPPQRNKPFYKDARVELSIEDDSDTGRIISFTATLDGVTKRFEVKDDPYSEFLKFQAYLEKLKGLIKKKKL